LSECATSTIGENAGLAQFARMTAHRILMWCKLTLVGISRTYCRAAAWSGDMFQEKLEKIEISSCFAPFDPRDARGPARKDRYLDTPTPFRFREPTRRS
jgi:hypothetical protein